MRLFGITAAVFVAAVVLLYPHFCDAVDPDATAYLTLTRRWANGDFLRAVNGYWSPFSIWLTALGMKCGLGEIPAAFVQNTAGGVAFLGASLLFREFTLPRKMLSYLVPALVVFAVHASFWQWFSDLWGAAFALLALWLLMQESFFARPAYWVLYGLLGALAYLSKSLYLPFFLLQAVAAIWLRGREISLGRRLSFAVLSGVVMATLCVPWWTALRAHYGFWTTGVAGSLNLSWGVLGHPIYKGGEGHLLSPLHPDSISFWEDPWWVNARLVHFWDSPALALHILPRVGYFALRLLGKAALMTVLLPLAWATILGRFFRNRFRLEGDFKTQLLQVVLVLFPLPFLLLHSEVRYCWFLVPLTVIYVSAFGVNRKFNRLIFLLLAASLCLHPAINLPQLWHLGRKEKALALQLKARGISGDFAADSTVSYGAALRVAYFSGMRYWAPAGKIPDSLLRREMKRVGVTYLLRENGMERVE